MFLLFDTETTGVPLRWDRPCTDTRNWPRLVELAWALHDANGKPLASEAHIVRPAGFTIPKDAERVHGISTARALLDGAALSEVLARFSASVDLATVVVAHNLAFDECVVGAEFVRQKQPTGLHGKAKVCTMRASTEYCRIPGRYGFKYPSLSELYFTLFGRAVEDAHRAEADVRATAECFFELLRRGVIQMPSPQP